MKKILVHAALILMLLAIPIISSPDFDGTLSVFQVVPFLREFIRFALCIIFFYLNLYVLLPKLFAKQKFIHFGVAIALCFSVAVYLPYILAPQVGTETINNNPSNTNTPQNLSQSKSNVKPELNNLPNRLPPNPPTNSGPCLMTINFPEKYSVLFCHFCLRFLFPFTSINPMNKGNWNALKPKQNSLI